LDGKVKSKNKHEFKVAGRMVRKASGKKMESNIEGALLREKNKKGSAEPHVK